LNILEPFHIRQLLPILSLFLILGCAPEMNEVVQEWKDKGWTQVRTHGTKKDFNRCGTLMSEKAQAVEASWVENGKRKTKLYTQDSHHYLALRFFCKDGDEFVIVMRKRK